MGVLACFEVFSVKRLTLNISNICSIQSIMCIHTSEPPDCGTNDLTRFYVLAKPGKLVVLPS
jgi:hypothetical protein